MGKILKSKKRQRRRARRAEVLEMTGTYYISDHSFMVKVSTSDPTPWYVDDIDRRYNWRIVSRGHRMLDVHTFKQSKHFGEPIVEYNDLIVQNIKSGTKYWAQSKRVRRLI